jgi:hypothetical protein
MVWPVKTDPAFTVESMKFRSSSPNRQLVALEGETNSEFDLSRSTERIDTRSDPNAIHVVARGCRTIDLTSCTCQ